LSLLATANLVHAILLIFFEDMLQIIARVRNREENIQLSYGPSKMSSLSRPALSPFMKKKFIAPLSCTGPYLVAAYALAGSWCMFLL